MIMVAKSFAGIGIIAGTAGFSAAVGWGLITGLNDTQKFVILLVLIVLLIILFFSAYVTRLILHTSAENNKFAKLAFDTQFANMPTADLRYPITRKNLPMVSRSNDDTNRQTAETEIPYRFRDGTETRVTRGMLEHLLSLEKVTREGWRWQNSRYSDAKRVLREHYAAIDAVGNWAGESARQLVEDDLYS